MCMKGALHRKFIIPSFALCNKQLVDSPARCLSVKAFRTHLSQLGVTAGKHCEQSTSVPSADRRAPSGRICGGHQGAPVCSAQSGTAMKTGESFSVGGPTDIHVF